MAKNTKKDPTHLQEISEARRHLHLCRTGGTLEHAEHLRDFCHYRGIGYVEIGTGENEMRMLFRDAMAKALRLCRSADTLETQYVELLSFLAPDSWGLLEEIGTDSDELDNFRHAAYIKDAQRVLSRCHFGLTVDSIDIGNVRAALMTGAISETDIIGVSIDKVEMLLKDARVREGKELLTLSRAGDEQALKDLMKTFGGGVLTPADVGLTEGELAQLRRSFEGEVVPLRLVKTEA
jgi:hypothetical protein